jgi:NADP-dependent 3-hydroxy acid dehydrogenase YdfG
VGFSRSSRIAIAHLAVDDWLAMADVNLNGFLYGIAAALPVFRRQGFGHFVTTIPPEAIARAIAFAIDQPEDVDVGDIVVRPTAQS